MAMFLVGGGGGGGSDVARGGGWCKQALTSISDGKVKTSIAYGMIFQLLYHS